MKTPSRVKVTIHAGDAGLLDTQLRCG